MLRCVDWKIFTDMSEVHYVSPSSGLSVQGESLVRRLESATHTPTLTYKFAGAGKA
jgi:hypothetical protein